jgi:LysR family transcriptional regulator, nitrogen assimilation regulatory protein
MDNLRQRLSDKSAGVHGEVSVGLPPSLGERLLVPLIEQLKGAHPALRLIVTEDLSRNLTSLVERRELDLALAYDVPRSPKFVMEKVESDPIGLATAGVGEISFGDTFEFSGLAEQPLVVQKLPHHMREVIERIAAQEGVTLNIAFEMQSGPAVLRLVEHGLGGTITALSAQPPLWRKHRLVFRRFTNPTITADLYLLRPAARSASKAQKAVASTLKALLLKHSAAPMLD